jgi:hypothetical protein
MSNKMEHLASQRLYSGSNQTIDDDCNAEETLAAHVD